jgi:hypothetical protein
MVQAKLYCKSVTEIKHSKESEPQKEVFLTTDTKREGNQDWSKWTPFAETKMTITNPPAAAEFIPGESYNVIYYRDGQDQEAMKRLVGDLLDKIDNEEFHIESRKEK